jgi:hypothetical protein
MNEWIDGWMDKLITFTNDRVRHWQAAMDGWSTVASKKPPVRSAKGAPANSTGIDAEEERVSACVRSIDTFVT